MFGWFRKKEPPPKQTDAFKKGQQMATMGLLVLVLTGSGSQVQRDHEEMAS